MHLLFVACCVITYSRCANDARDSSASSGHAGPRGAVQRPVQGQVDSILAIDEQLRRFQAGLDPVRAFTGGAHTRDALVQQWLSAIERTDTNAVRRLLLARPEFAYLYYPVSPYTYPPYQQAPQLVWFQTEFASEQGITRVLRRLGGKPLRATSSTCNPVPKQWGQMKIWDECLVQWRDSTGVVTRRKLFGAIAEYGGQFKFVSYTNGY
jgi:hypothetical protein